MYLLSRLLNDRYKVPFVGRKQNSKRYPDGIKVIQIKGYIKFKKNVTPKNALITGKEMCNDHKSLFSNSYIAATKCQRYTPSGGCKTKLKK